MSYYAPSVSSSNAVEARRSSATRCCFMPLVRMRNRPRRNWPLTVIREHGRTTVRELPSTRSRICVCRPRPSQKEPNRRVCKYNRSRSESLMHPPVRARQISFTQCSVGNTCPGRPADDHWRWARLNRSPCGHVNTAPNFRLSTRFDVAGYNVGQDATSSIKHSRSLARHCFG